MVSLPGGEIGSAKGNWLLKMHTCRGHGVDICMVGVGVGAGVTVSWVEFSTGATVDVAKASVFIRWGEEGVPTGVSVTPIHPDIPKKKLKMVMCQYE